MADLRVIGGYAPMGILSHVAGEVFTLRVYKHLDIAVSQFWANTWEIRSRASGTITGLKAACQALVDFESELALDTTQFDRYVLSTYVEDGTPYNPSSFVSQPLSTTGARTSGAAALQLPLNIVLFIRRDVLTGRTGKLYLRNVLEEGDVNGRFGEIQLTSLATWVSRVSSALSGSGADDLLAGGASDYVISMASGAGASPAYRDITDLVPVAGRIVQFNNRYYDVP